MNWIALILAHPLGMVVLLPFGLVALFFFVRACSAVCREIVSEKNWKSARFGAVLAFICLGYFLCGCAFIYFGDYVRGEPVVYRVPETLTLYSDYRLTNPQDAVPAGTTCVVPMQWPSRFFINPKELFRERCRFFCEGHHIGWGSLTSWQVPFPPEQIALRIAFILIADFFFVMSFGLFFTIIKEEKKSFDAENQSEISSDC